jgi:mRNA interferase YafQ
MLRIRPTARFKKDLKKAMAIGHDMDKLKKVLETLSMPEPLPLKFQEHKLKGEWQDFRECHIEPDWLLIYTIADCELRLARLGSHSKLFE